MPAQPAPHPDAAQLQLLATGALDAEAAAPLEQHLRKCAACTAFAASLRRAHRAAAPAQEDVRADASDITDEIALTPVDQPAGNLEFLTPADAPAASRANRRATRIVAGALAIVIVLMLVATSIYVDQAGAAAPL